VDDRERFIRNTLVIAAGIGAAGVVACLLLGRGGWAAGFGVGATISLGNFFLIARAVMGVWEDAPEARGRLWKGALFRFGIVGVVLMGALLVLREALLALIAGLLLTQVAMIAWWAVRAFRADA
jgi:formate/nitrite transporter FocA (FNT family)